MVWRRYEGLSGEVAPQLVPYRRYVLPRAAPALLRDLAPPSAPSAPPAPSAPSGAPLERYYGAAEQFVAHALANPDYLHDEIVAVGA